MTTVQKIKEIEDEMAKSTDISTSLDVNQLTCANQLKRIRLRATILGSSRQNLPNSVESSFLQVVVEAVEAALVSM
ncbi:hypothetical protein H2248_006230 [Termitomyces sp. 'cryptogamus']|nr:hypothetical protein H2248_006230 [Termitomyces sp. 'cryptogamus']